ncbi:IS1595 family transposase [Desulforhopalus sp. IMCC35007]|uniref:IS1595 family transposase n=1 Tax=Desulforhopalus sp. IMCC35007 TaxID=2569543 RepID=UPI0010AEB9AA|nr:IS1595 family transposase [Desulforhopalus sp. IMCC35007]TKB05860.1 IS1595 family transposase [Desulforhopalus sp. IMCC35007]
MPKNKIQFQKGLSLQNFLKSYGTEEDCRNRLFNMKWPTGFCCPQCGCNHYYTITTRNLYQCTACKHQSSLISGTIFGSSKLPLTTWFLAIYFITQSKDGLSALHLRRLLGISVNAAFRLKQKIQHVMKSSDDSLRLDNLVELDDVYWGGKKSGKRGRGASGKTPFLAAVSHNDNGHPIHMRMSKVKAFTSNEIERWALRHLDDNCVVVTDGFRSFSSICHVVDLHHSINTAGIYEDPDNKFFHWVNTMIGNVKRSIHGTYHSVSSKHLPRYLAEFNFRFNNRFNMGSMIEILIKQAIKTEPLPQYKLKRAEEWG